MNKMIARTALVATLAVSAMSLSACGTNSNDCAHAAGTASTVTATTAMFPAPAGGGSGHASGHAAEEGVHSETSTGSRGFRWFWMGNDHSDQCENPAPATKS